MRKKLDTLKTSAHIMSSSYYVHPCNEINKSKNKRYVKDSMIFRMFVWCIGAQLESLNMFRLSHRESCASYFKPGQVESTLILRTTLYMNTHQNIDMDLLLLFTLLINSFYRLINVN